MHAFARDAMLAAPAGSPLGHLVAEAHIEHWLDLEKDARGSYLTSKQVRASLHEAADRSVRHPAYRQQRGWPAVHNVFAMAFFFARDYHAAADLFQVIGDHVTMFPWGYAFADPGAGYCRARAAALAVVKAANRLKGHS